MQLVYVLDCVDAEALAEFWAPALGFRRESFHPPYLRLADPAGRWPDLLLQQVPEPKAGKNRMHLDIRVTELAPELERLRALGATVRWEPHDDDGFYTAVLADPQGNEFCVIVPPAGPGPPQPKVDQRPRVPTPPFLSARSSVSRPDER